MYEVEIWGWDEREKLQSIKIMYERWTLGMHTMIIGLQEEYKVESVSIEAKCRTLKYKEKLRITKNQRKNTEARMDRNKKVKIMNNIKVKEKFKMQWQCRKRRYKEMENTMQAREG